MTTPAHHYLQYSLFPLVFFLCRGGCMVVHLSCTCIHQMREILAFTGYRQCWGPQIPPHWPVEVAEVVYSMQLLWGGDSNSQNTGGIFLRRTLGTTALCWTVQTEPSKTEMPYMWFTMLPWEIARKREKKLRKIWDQLKPALWIPVGVLAVWTCYRV